MQTILYFGRNENEFCSEWNKGQKGQKKSRSLRDREGGDEWTRTTDSRIFSPMLYQLSYITVV